MSIRQGKKLIASSTTNGFNLFDCKWADHILNNISWLRADTFSWQSGDVYKSAYEHLVDDLANRQYATWYYWYNEIFGTVRTLSQTPFVGDLVISIGRNPITYEQTVTVIGTVTAYNSDSGTITCSNGYTFATSDGAGNGPLIDTVGDINIIYYGTKDGHKICLPNQESNIVALYQATGVAWYYILDKENKQFKLPRTKFGFTGIRNGVGGYVAPGLPNITGAFNCDSKNRGASGVFALQDTASVKDSYSSTYDTLTTYSFNASRSNSIYGNSDTVQPQATEMYLYFYVGNYVENATTVDVGKLTEIVNDFDIDTFKPEVDEAKNEAIVDINDAKTDAIGSLTNLATDLGSSLKYGNVGDIFYTSRLDVSLNGAVECNGNLYNTTDFSGAQSIGNLLRDSKVPYISLAEHQTTVDTYGSCRCFGWDGGTEFRVPKLTDVFIEAGVAASEGEFITAGLPNITGSFTVGADFESQAGAFGGSSTGFRGSDNNGDNGGYVNFNASRSSSIYGNSTTVQPPAVRYRAMVQLAFGATDDAVVTAGNVLADIAGIKDGDGFTQLGKNAIVGWGIPDYSAGVVVANNYITTFPCYAVARNPSNAFNQTGVSIYVDDIKVFSSSNGNSNVNKTFCAVCYVDAGHTVSYSGDGTIEMTIYPLIGAN